MAQMKNRPILRLPNARPTERRTKAKPNPRTFALENRATQKARFQKDFDRLEAALSNDNAALELRSDPSGIAPERGLVFVTKSPVKDFASAARRINLEVLTENHYEEVPANLISPNIDHVNHTFYTTLPTQGALEKILQLWKKQDEDKDVGSSTWEQFFGMLSELRAWGPEDRLSPDSIKEIKNRIANSDNGEVRLELEVWSTFDSDNRERWRNDAARYVDIMGGRVIHDSVIERGGFIYDALLAAISSDSVLNLLENPSAPESIATFDGIQFILPQGIAQSFPNLSTSEDDSLLSNLDTFDSTSPFRALLLDGTPMLQHPALSNGVEISDVHNLTDKSVVSNRKHATEMASLILRGDIREDGTAIQDSRLISIPVLIDHEDEAISPEDKLFVDVIDTALDRAFRSDQPLAPDAFVVNFSIGVKNSNFFGRISALGRLLDWWARDAGILFVISAGNISEDLIIAETSSTDFEDASVAERYNLVRAAKKNAQHSRTLLSPAEALNGLTVSAASMDFSTSPFVPASGSVSIQNPGSVIPAISSAVGLGPFGSIKPDVIAPGGIHEIRAQPQSGNLKLKVVKNSPQSGLNVAGMKGGKFSVSRSRGTSCAAAIMTRYLLQSAASLVAEGGPYEGIELSRENLALLTRALSVNAARWPESAEEIYAEENPQGSHHFRQAAEEVARNFGHGFIDFDRMIMCPDNSATLVGLGTIKKDGAVIFNMPLPQSMSGDSLRRSMIVTLTWFSPIDVSRSRYRLAALEAISADADIEETKDKDDEWKLGMKSRPPSVDILKRGTVWSRRFVHKRLAVPIYKKDTVLPIRVECKDTSGGALGKYDEINFAIAITLQIDDLILFNIYDEIKDSISVLLDHS